MKKDNLFFDVYYKKAENPVFCYRSGLSVYEETFYKGALISSGYNGAGYPLDVLTNFPSRLDYTDFAEPFAFNLEIDGQSVDFHNEFVDFLTEKTEEKLHATLVLRSTIKPVKIKVHTILDGTQTFTRYIELENLSDELLNISRMGILCGGLEDHEEGRYPVSVRGTSPYSVGYFDSDQWGNEGEFNWHPLANDAITIDTRFNRDRFRHPLIFIKNNVSGKIWYSQIGWSGGCRFTVDCNRQPATRDDIYLSFKAEITAHNPMYVLKPHEIFTSPEVHMGFMQGSFDDAVNDMHHHIRKSVLNYPENNPASLLVGCGMGAEHDMSVETSKKFIDQFASVGGEIFIIDAGWECPPNKETEWGNYNGINIPNSERYPNGISEIVDYCHEKGMKFGLWVEIESLGKYSNEYKSLPEWRGKNIFGEQTERFLDFTKPEVAAWAESELERIIREYKLDLLRVDYNTSYRDYFAMTDTGTGRLECASLRHFNAVFRMYNNLKKKFPDVIFENCAGGGGRTDLQILKAFNHTWVSDWQCAPRSVNITNALTIALPPERVDRLFAGMGSHSFADLGFQIRSCMLGHMSINVTRPASATENPVQAEFVKHSIQVYKDFIRPILPQCKIFHHTEENKACDETGICILEIASPDKSKGVATIFTLANPEKNVINLRLKGANMGKTYKVTLDNSGASFTASGKELCFDGINIEIDHALSSELVLYECVSQD